MKSLKQFAKKALYNLNQNPISKHLHTQDILSRSELDLTDITRLSRKISMFSSFTHELHKPNDWYGHASNLKKYLGLPQTYQFKFILEHGLYLNDQVDNIDIETKLPSMLTYSNFRANVLRQYRPHIYSIGPFIHYAKSYLSKTQINKEKARLGKSVLFFPAHSSSMIGIEYDNLKLCRQIKKIAKSYDSVRVCLYWKDVLLGKHRIYQDQGFECVSAGHMLDPLFLPRLKSIILTSDLTLTNIVSSQVGFCIFLKKPHIVLENKLKLNTTHYWKKRIDEVFNSTGYTQILHEFTKPNYKIASSQSKLIDKYWGSKLVKSKSQLKKIVNETERIYMQQT